MTTELCEGALLTERWSQSRSKRYLFFFCLTLYRQTSSGKTGFAFVVTQKLKNLKNKRMIARFDLKPKRNSDTPVLIRNCKRIQQLRRVVLQSLNILGYTGSKNIWQASRQLLTCANELGSCIR